MSNTSDDKKTRFTNQLRELGVYEEVKSLCVKNGFTSVGELYGPSRLKHIARARHEAMHFLRERFKWSYPVLGSFFDRDHTSVMSACRKVAAERLSSAKEG